MTRKALLRRLTAESAALGELFDEALVQVVLTFANTEIKAEADVTEVFADTLERWVNGGAMTRDECKLFMLGWQEALLWLRGALRRVKKYSRGLSPEKRAEIRKDVNASLTSWKLQIGPKGLEYRRVPVWAAGYGTPDVANGVYGVCARALLPFLIPVDLGGWPPSRLSTCDNRKCGVWFLRSSNSRQTYCSPGHGNSERVMRCLDKKRGRKRIERPTLLIPSARRKSGKFARLVLEK